MTSRHVNTPLASTLHFTGMKLLWKTKLMLACQNFLLSTLGRSAPGSVLQAAIQNFSKRVVGGYPYVIKLDVMDTCNLKCKMCYAENKNREVPLDNLLHMLKQIGKVPVRLDLLGGEPMLRDDICELISFAKSNTGASEIVLYTNGTLASEDAAKNLAVAGLDKVLVTFISHNPQKHDNFTGIKNSWEKTVAGIKNFIKAGIKTYTFTAIHSENAEDFEDIYQYVKNELKTTPLFYQYVPQKQNDPLLISPECWSMIKHKILCDYSSMRFEYIKRILTFCGKICLGGYYSISIKTDGTVTPCPFMYDIRLGNAFNENIWDIFAKRYKSKEFREFMSLPKECERCLYKNLCGGGCKAGNKILFDNHLAKDCRCMGHWAGQIEEENMQDKLPTFF